MHNHSDDETTFLEWTRVIVGRSTEDPSAPLHLHIHLDHEDTTPERVICLGMPWQIAETLHDLPDALVHVENHGPNEQGVYELSVHVDGPADPEPFPPMTSGNLHIVH